MKSKYGTYAYICYFFLETNTMLWTSQLLSKDGRGPEFATNDVENEEEETNASQNLRMETLPAFASYGIL